VFIANPNAPTGLSITLNDIEKLLKSNKDRVVVIDEAYVDFGAESAVKLIKKYDNLLVTQTFSKSRSMAGARLGFGVASKKIIDDLKTVKYSTNPYNVNRVTACMGIGALKDAKYFKQNVASIIENREAVTKELKLLGFTCLESKTNFIFCKSDKIGGEEYYLSLKARGVLVRHFRNDKIKDYVRITIGTKEQMDILLSKTDDILSEG
jgi:histidinol-phosphate aminotransferase